MYVVSGLSGSKPADVAAVGTVMRDELRERHGAAEGAAVLAASAIMGETVPPSIAMLIVGSITSVSVGAMFIGGLIPAAIMAICLMVLINVRARRSGDGDLQQSPAPVANQRVNKAHEPYANPATFHDQAGQNEEGNGKQDEISGAVHHGLWQHDEGTRIGDPQVDGCGEEQHEAHGHTDEDGNEEPNLARATHLAGRTLRAAAPSPSGQGRR
jgi:hypothetical protein